MSNPWTIVPLVIAIVATVFAGSFLLAAVLIFASCDQRPLDQDTDRMLTLAAWTGNSPLIATLAVTRYWGQCQHGRRLFYAGLISGCLATLCGLLAALGG